MNLKAMREKSGLTQAELASLSGVNLRSLQDYEQGHKSLYSAKGETLMRLSLALGYSIEDILKGVSVNLELNTGVMTDMNRRIALYERCLSDRKTSALHFPIVEADESVDMSGIYPTKQVFVKRVLDELRPDSRVASLRIFGSSITMACHRDSDIDFAVELKSYSEQIRNEISEKIQNACEWGADIIWIDHLSADERIYKNIMKGLILI